MAKKPSGTCRLVGTVGVFAKAHIIPDAFLQRATDAPFLECGVNSPPRKRFTGWYDQGILGLEGERLIADYDNEAAKCFIENGFTYRARRDPHDLNKLGANFVADQVYEIDDVNTTKLRLFGLSLLWRAAVTSIDAFELVKVSHSHLLDIRARLAARDPGPFTEYPIYFAVFCDAEELMKVAPYRPKNYPFYRFFLDGVVCYVCPRRRIADADQRGLLFAGSETNRLRVPCLLSIGSNHSIQTSRAAQEIHRQRGDIFAGFKSPASRRR
jgi:hypothetical protein